MRVSVIAAGIAGFVLLAAGPAAAQCSWESAGKEPVIASTVEAPVATAQTSGTVLTPRRPAPREIIVTRGVPAVTGIRPAPVEPPAIYVIEATGAVVDDPQS